METRQYLMLTQQSVYASTGKTSVVQQQGNEERTRSLPASLQRGMEKLTGVNLHRVRVHYNSPKPAQVKAHAYAQGEDIYLAPGQEHHLPHELGHVVQQALNMVKPTMTVNGVAINDDPKLEQHATELGNKAIRLGRCLRVLTT